MVTYIKPAGMKSVREFSIGAIVGVARIKEEASLYVIPNLPRA